LALEYGEAFGFPVWINRCGVMAGAGQFGRADQGIVSFWIHSWKEKRPLRYIGFDGEGNQVRDCLHPADLIPLLERQLGAVPSQRARTVNVSGGRASSFSLRQLSDWCQARFGRHTVGREAEPRPFDIPWMVLDSALATQTWDFAPLRSRESIFEEIALHAERNPEWLSLSEA
jgi:CDP-paratose 2-epimerase